MSDGDIARAPRHEPRADAHRPGSRRRRERARLHVHRDLAEPLLVPRHLQRLPARSGSSAGSSSTSDRGGILDHLAEAASSEVEWVLHTHHHRDQCQGDHLLAARGRPDRGARAGGRALRRDRRLLAAQAIYDNYDVSSIGFTLASPVPVAATPPRLRDVRAGAATTSGCCRRRATRKGSVTFARRDRRRRATAFCGDLIAEPGRVHTIHDLQWQYGHARRGRARRSTRPRSSRVCRSSRLLPVARPADRRARRARCARSPPNLRELYGLLARDAAQPASGRAGRTPSTSPRRRSCRTSGRTPTRWRTRYALVADDGRALLLDYGFPSWDHFFADQRFVEHSLDELRALAGISAVDAVDPEPLPRRPSRGRAVAPARARARRPGSTRRFAGIVERPGRTANAAVPAGRAHPRRPRPLRRRARSPSADWSFDVFHMPGHTWWALGLAGEVDGSRVAFTGDNLLAGTISPLRAAAPDLPQPDASRLDRGSASGG